ncbi:MAG: class I SAM-dependent methyltransferase [Acidimicrobiia bacterium]
MSSTGPRYDVIGQRYAEARRPDPRIAARILAALGDARTVVNVGAGSGNYEPPDRAVVAVEPSLTMIAQRPPGAAPAVQGVAEHLPFADAIFDAALATLTVHHWRDRAAGLAELRRVADRQVIFAFDRTLSATYWLVDDYFREYRALESEQTAPTPDEIGQHLDVRRVEVIPVPADCTDGFGGAYWRRPEGHLDPTVRAGMSWLAQLEPAVVERNLARLADELADGRWEAKYGHLRHQTSIDLGYRLLVCG